MSSGILLDVGTPIDEVFADGGYLARARADYQKRAGQVQMAEAVELGITGEQTTTVIQAPTGTGKSIALLVPALYHSVHHAKRAIYVTANIALQEQLITKDLPGLQEALPWSFNFALAKGINNYLCNRAFEKNAGEIGFLGLGDAEADKQWSKVVQWAKRTELGDFSELPFELHPKVRLKIATTADDCVGKTCKQYEGCHGIRSRRAIQRAHIVVTNYHLFCADLQIRIAGGDGVLPAHDTILLDELHAAGDIARDFLGFRITLGAIRWAVRPLAGMGKDKYAAISPKLGTRVSLEADRFFDALALYSKSKDYKARLTR